MKITRYSVRTPAFLLSALLLTLASNSWSMSVKPLLIEMQSSGKTSSATLLVTNDGNSPLPVELIVEKLVLDNKGKQSLSASEDKWLIFPPQAILPPGRKQNFRIQWLGDPAMEASESFHIVVKQVPVKMPEGKSGVQLVYNFRSLVNIAPAGTRGSLSVSETRISRDTSGTPRILLSLENQSNTHSLLSSHEVKISVADQAGTVLWSKKLTPSDIMQTLGVGLIQPHKSRTFTLPFDLPESVKSASNAEVRVLVRDRNEL